jgi:hypothetical protein
MDYPHGIDKSSLYTAPNDRTRVSSTASPQNPFARWRGSAWTLLASHTPVTHTGDSTNKGRQLRSSSMPLFRPNLWDEHWRAHCNHGTSSFGIFKTLYDLLTGQPVDLCIEEYMKLSKNVFPVDNVIKQVPVSPDHCRFNEEPLERAHQADYW